MFFIKNRSPLAALAAFAALAACLPGTPAGGGNRASGSGGDPDGQNTAVMVPDPADRLIEPREPGSPQPFRDQLERTLEAAEFPGELSRRIRDAALEGPSFILDLLTALEGDPFLRLLVDKAHPLPDGYEPGDLTELAGGSYTVSREGLMLRRSAADALEAMAAAARSGGITLTASSAYRSCDYQAEVYARNVRELGREAADRESARPGYSQHQLGLVVDFGSITNDFAETRAGRWMEANAGRFGWSLSFPRGFEALTGYRWESWHYRYVGPELAAFIDTYFGGIQQYALRFLYEWERQTGEASRHS
ncbi:MAG: M15 family metallopeptidase [Treponema sp.]|jgi:D-alanyl-D-alanine carboxypeptidase|nr:M15 family metallopeptidase [Treponema sp.]